MTSKRAIEILRKQQEFLNSRNHNQLDELWLIQTEYYFRKFFMPDSWQIKIISEIKFPSIHEQNYDSQYESVKMKLNLLLSNSIEIINDVGIEIPYKNFLSRLSDGWLIFIIGAITVGSYSVGTWVDSHTFLKPTPIIKPIIVTPRPDVKNDNPNSTIYDTVRNRLNK